jgi:hypothetical protein
MPGAHDTNLGKLLDVFIVAVARRGGRGGVCREKLGNRKEDELGTRRSVWGVSIGSPHLVSELIQSTATLMDVHTSDV